jgi:membrane-bound lytic murein transglycosylase B
LLGSWLKTAVAVVPLALVGAGVAAETGEHETAPPAAAETPEMLAPAAPDDALHDPASATVAPLLRPAALAASVRMEQGTESMHEIPATALAAYQRAEAVMGATDASCKLRWQLLAAIGRIESDHGRFAGSQLAEDGRVQPAIFGRRLDGTRSTSRILDTDGGRHDGDLRFDRAMGPMQFIPSTWSVVGVDADGDSRRDPQDIDDAALSAAVYLCSGDEDLSTTPGVRAAVYRYNHSEEYVALVLALYEAYSQAAPVGVDILPPTYAVDSVRARPAPTVTPRGDRDGDGRTVQAQPASPATSAGAKPTAPASPSAPGSAGPTDPPTGPGEPTDPGEPSGEPTQPTDPTGPSDPGTGEPTDPAQPTEPPADCAASQADTDSDGDTNAADTDLDGDGTANTVDADVDGDEVANADDPDADGDGRPDAQCPPVPGQDVPAPATEPGESTSPEPTPEPTPEATPSP